MDPVDPDQARGTSLDEAAAAQDARIEEIAEQYLADLHAGKAADLQALLSSHPEIAARLEPRLRMMELMFRAKPETADSPGANRSTISVRDSLS